MKIMRMVAGLCAFAMLMPIAVQAKTMEFTMGSQDVYVSDEGIEKKWVETAPYTENDRTMVPARIIGECFGAQVGWEETTRTVTIDDGTTHITLQLDSNEAIVNGETKYLDVAARELNGRTMVPLRFISENLGKDVEYIESTEQILIDDEDPIMSVNGYDYTIEDVRFLWVYSGNAQRVWTDAQKATAVRSMLEQLEKNALLGDYAAENGYFLDASTKKNVGNEVLSMAESLYQQCLVAPGVKFYEKYFQCGYYLSEKYTQADLNRLYEEYFVCAKHILISTEGCTEAEKAEKKALAENVRNELLWGADFDEMCKTYGQDPGMKENPDGYVFTKGEMVKGFEEAAFALKVGTISEVVKTQFGYHIIKREPLPDATRDNYDVVVSKETGKEMDAIYDKMEKEADTKVYKKAEEIAAML